MATIKSNITFDKLDKKCIQELPLMIDVIASTFNRIKLLYDPFYADMNKVIKSELKKKRKWHQSPSGTYGITFDPFTYENITNTTKITTLENTFDLGGYFIVYSGGHQWSKRKASFIIYLRFDYDPAEVYKYPWSYFQITNQNVKKFGNIADENFYRKLCSSIKEKYIEAEYEYPSLDYEEEQIWVSCKTLDTELIIKAYNSFRDKILIPFIRHLR